MATSQMVSLEYFMKRSHEISGFTIPEHISFIKSDKRDSRKGGALEALPIIKQEGHVIFHIIGQLLGGSAHVHTEIF